MMSWSASIAAICRRWKWCRSDSRRWRRGCRRDRPAVAESGVATAGDAVRMMRLGFRLALIGTALMTHDDPQRLLREILATTRTVKA